MWPDKVFMDRLGIKLPIIQAPMAGAVDAATVIAVARAGGLGSLPCAMLSVEKIRNEIGVIRQQVNNPINLNFFCHQPFIPKPVDEADWKEHLAGYYEEFGLDKFVDIPSSNRAPFDNAMCEVVEEAKPGVVSFHFGLPVQTLLERVKATGALVLSSATTVAEAKWLADQGCDGIIAQGLEAGGHRGIFLNNNVSTQPGTLALVPQVVDAVSVPVIAAGGIADGRGIAAAIALGAAAVQMGTAYLFTPEATISDLHRAALSQASDDTTALTNIFSGRPARGIMNRVMQEIGPMSDKAPPFPTAGGALAPLKAVAESNGGTEFTSLWSGQSAALGRSMGAEKLTQTLAAEAAHRLAEIAQNF